MRHRGRLALAAAAAVVVTGCGGRSADEFRAKADSICADTRAAVDNVGEARTLAGLAKLAPRTEARARSGLAKLRALGDPPEGVRDWGLLLEALAAQLPLLDRLSAARDATTVERLAVEGRALEARADAAAKGAGLRTCGVAPALPGA